MSSEDGHAVLAADLLWRSETAQRWSRTPMRLHGNDRWSASFVPARVGRYLYAIEAWTDAFATWRRDLITKRDAGLDVTVEMQEGTLLLNRLKSRAEVHMRKGRCGKFEAGGGEMAEGGAEDPLSDELAAWPGIGKSRTSRAASAVRSSSIDRSRGQAPGMR